jgi:two-component system sensor histidine kinase BaeS
MKLSLKTKVFLSYALMIALTIFLFAWITDSQVGSQFNNFYEAIRKLGFSPGEHPEFRGREAFEEAVEKALLLTLLSVGLIGLILSSFISGYITKPLRHIIEATTAISKGNYKKRVTAKASGEILELKEALNTMAENLQEDQIMQEELISNVAHELATPLTNIRGYVEALHDDVIKGKKKQKEVLSTLMNETDRLALMVKEMRELATIQNPKFSVKKVPRDISKICTSVITQMEPSAKEKKIAIEFNNQLTSENTSTITIPLDPNRMKQILLNLLSNAVEHADKKSTIKINLKAFKPNKNWIQLSISNQGKTISKEDLPYLFDRFYRASKSRTRKSKSSGLGIGLSIVKQLVKAHGGTIDVTSKNKKTTFTLMLASQ